ncbi:MAG: O-antigen ligase family protein [Lachnospiraceae bacterium]
MDKAEGSIGVQPNKGMIWCKEIGQGIMMAYFIVIAVVYPFYAPGGYVQIGEVKYVFFRNVTLVTIAVMLLLILIWLVQNHNKGKLVELYQHMSVSDWFAYGYLIVIMLSYLCSSYKTDALWGVEGWHMGVVSQMMFVLLYFFISRFFVCNRKWLSVWLAVAGAVFVLGILNRYSIYPIAMEGQTETFISTLGNINWFCGYWAVTAPLSITLYWCADRKSVRIFAGIFSGIAMLAGITQGSSSAYLVYLAVFGVLLIFSVQSNEKLFRFLELGMVFAVSCVIGRIMRFIPGLRYNYGNNIYPTGSYIADLLLDGNAALWLLAGMAVCYGLLYAMQKYRGFQMEGHRMFQRYSRAALVFLYIVFAVILLRNSGMFSCNTEADETVAYEDGGAIFRDDWGNSRGAAWNCGIGAYRSMDTVHRIVGIGPDCFADYVYEISELAERLVDQFGNERLTNAHNEWLTVLVNTGWLGLFCYTGIFITIWIRCIKRAKGQLLLYVCVVSILAYTVHNMVSFQQILSTPYIFMVLGMGEGLLRRTETASESTELV